MAGRAAILTTGEVTIEADENGVLYVKTLKGVAEIVTGDVAMMALARVRLLELTVERLAAELETIKNG